MQRCSKLLGLGLSLALTATLACSSKNESTGDVAKADNAAGAKPAAVDIGTSTAIERLIERNVETVGSLIADEQVTVSSQVKGVVAEITVDLGSPVTAGQVIARISPREYELKLQQAEAALQQARARLGLRTGTDKLDVDQATEVRQAKASLDDAKLKMDRTRKLLETGDVPQERLDAAEISYRTMEARYQAARDNTINQWGLIEQREAEFQLAKKNLEDSTIKAPISGIVSAKLVSRGEYIADMGGKRDLVTIVKSNPLRLQANVSEIGISFVQKGVGVEFTVDAYPGRTFKATVSRVSPTVNAQSRLMLVEATAPNGEGQLKPGMFAKVFVKTSNKIPAVLVPGTAVSSIVGINKVYVVNHNTVEERQVKLGLKDGEMVEITSGLKVGETVAISNLDKLSNGKTVVTK
ncbi:MAG: efflux RND transporter periplasmic adaptor subunit [Blastocatellia bacterium]|nr:efflux RND transporter periplasmic adaptor subunit [Blastocatellia bacterium]